MNDRFKYGRVSGFAEALVLVEARESISSLHRRLGELREAAQKTEKVCFCGQRHDESRRLSADSFGVMLQE